ncbi:MAG: hypothetical protein WCG20_00280 [bacterium]
MNTYSLTPRFFLIRDKSSQQHLDHLFQDSHAMFKIRIQHLGNKTKITTDEESETLRVMLEALISAKQQLQTGQ